MILVWLFVAAAILFGLLGLSLYMLRPETEKTRSFAAFDHTMIAHRGLFDNHSEAPENSLAAFRKAALSWTCSLPKMENLWFSTILT